MNRNQLIELREKIATLSEEEKIQRNLYLQQLSNGELQGPNTGYPSLDKPWLSNYSKDAITYKIPEKTVFENLYDNNKTHLNDKAIEYYGNEITYLDLFKKITEAAKGLKSKGLKENDTITLLSVTLPETIYLFYAANYLGIRVNLLDPRTNPSRIKECIDECECKNIFVIDAYLQKVESSLPKDIDITVLNVTDSLNVIPKTLYKLKSKISVPRDLLKQENIDTYKNFVINGKKVELPKHNKYKKNQVASIDYTGGTTGTPKAAELTNECLNGIAAQYKISNIDISRGQSMLNIMPIFLAYGINMLNMSLSLGVENILVPVFKAEEFDKLLLKYHPNHFMGVPMHYEPLLRSKKLIGKDLSWWKTPGSGGDSANTGLEEKINEFLDNHNCPSHLTKGYGMTELSSAAATCTDKINAIGSVGIPLVKNTIAIFDPNTNEELEYGKIGEICISGPTIMKSYLKNPKETEKIIRVHNDGNTYIHTGDLGKIDENGLIYLLNRKKRVVIRPDGHNVFPSSIENVLANHPAVKEVAVIGVKATEFISGSWTKAIVVLNDEYIGQEKEIQKELEEMSLEALPERDVACSYEFTSSLPLTSAGKIDIKELEEKYDNQKVLKMVL